MGELTGKMQGTGAMIKCDVQDGKVVFRGQWKGDVPFSEIVAEARGTLLVLHWRGHIAEFGAGSRANQLSGRIRKGV